jgi:hypothetical protein
LFLAGSREDDAGQSFPAIIVAHGGQDVESAEMRHHEIQDHERDIRLPPQNLERLAAVVGQRHAKRSLLELHLDDAADMWFVVGDEHVARRGGADHEVLYESGDVTTIPPQLEQELADVGAGRHENEQDGLG